MGGFSFCTLKRLFGSGMRFFEEKNIKMKFRQSFVIKKKTFSIKKWSLFNRKKFKWKKNKKTLVLQDERRRKKQRCQWCGNHIKTTLFLGGLFVLCLATGLFTHLFIYWTKYLVKVRPDDKVTIPRLIKHSKFLNSKWNAKINWFFHFKVMSIGAIPFPAVTICPGTKPGYPPLNFTHLLRLMQVYREPQLKLDE